MFNFIFMETMLIIAGLLAVLVLIFIIVLKPRHKPKVIVDVIPDNYRNILQDNVKFYQTLDEGGKKRFEEKLQHFLSGIRVTGVRTEVEDIDRVLLGASAIIPIYAFDEWEYHNLNEVLLYPEAFSHEFEQEGGGRSVAGMVGEGPLQHVMIISQQALRQGFLNKTDKNNTAIHEFVHLVDKTDGYADGIPEILLQHQYTLPWLEMIHQHIKAIRKNKSDIDPYGATNQAEFLAVVSEYFFERPDLLRAKHPELYAMLTQLFGHISPKKDVHE